MSERSTAFHDAFKTDWKPLLDALGFAKAKAPGIKAGVTIEQSTRVIDSQRRFELAVWCEGPHVKVRLDRVEPTNGIECHTEIQLRVEFPGGAKPLNLCASELLPHESIERMQLTVRFLASAFAASAEQLAQAAPELASDIRAAAATPAWRAATQRVGEIWEQRHTRGVVEDRPVAGKLVFGGEKLIYVEVEGRRLMFRVPVAQIDRNQPITVSGWCKTATGTQVATRLVHAGRTWSFDLRGEVTAVSPAL